MPRTPYVLPIEKECEQYRLRWRRVAAIALGKARGDSTRAQVPALSRYHQALRGLRPGDLKIRHMADTSQIEQIEQTLAK